MSKYINLATDFGFKQESDCTNDIPLFKPKFIHTLTLAAALILAAAAARAQNNPGAESHSVTVPSGSGLEVSTPTATQGTYVGGKFSVAQGKQVMFAPGNLQYNAGETPQWRFAEHQYSICHTTGDNVGDDYKDWKDGEKYKWTDIFGWGTWLSAGGQQPYETQTGDAKEYTWSGTSAIGSDWETLTNKEWCYLFSYESARLGNFTNDTRKDKYGWGSIVLSENKSVNGMILLPDDWTSKPEGVNTVFKPGMTSGNNAYPVSEWALMEEAGAVFLPAAGGRYGTDVYNVGGSGNYWSSTAFGAGYAYRLCFYSGLVGPGRAYGRNDGLSVRLVRRL